MAENKEKLILELRARGVNLTKGQLKQLDKQVGNTNKSFGTMAAGIAGATVALYALGKATSAIISTGKEFEQGMANVKAISGATAAEFKALEASAKKLGASTKFTATEISGLQTEFAKLGFTSTEINKVTKGTLALASAVGADLAESAAVAGATLRGFGLDTKETGRVTDVMAKSFSSSALDMQKFSDSMKYVAPVAKLAGFSIEGTTAIMGQLANAGIDGSMAGTALRKIFLELSNESSKLSQRLGGSVSSVDELIPALQKLNAEGVTTAEMKDMVGQRAISAFSILLSGSGDVDTLAESLRNAGGAAQEMADIQLDTLEGKMTIMKSAMEGLQITLFDTFSNELKFIVDDVTIAVQKLTNNIETQRLENARLSGSWNDLSLAMQKSLLEQEIALKKQAIELESQPSMIYAIGQAFMRWDTEVRGPVSTAQRVLEGFTKNLDNSSNGMGVNKEKINEMASELKDLETQLDSVNSSLERPVEIGESVEVPEDLFGVSEEIGPTDEQYQMALDHMSEFNQATLDLDRDARVVRLEAEEEAAIEAMEKLKITDEQKAQLKESIQKEFGFRASKLQKKIDKQELDQKLTQYSKLLGGASSFLSQFGDMERAAARLQQAKAIVDTYSSATKAYQLHGGWPGGVVPAAASIAYGMANVMSIGKAIGDFGGKRAAIGMDEVVDSPTMILAGEAGAEQVSITPLEGPNLEGPQGGGQNITLNISAPLVDDTVVDSIIPAIREAIRRGEDIGIS